MKLAKYRLREDFTVDVGFSVSATQVLEALDLTDRMLTELPAGLYRSLDYKTTSAIVGSTFCDALARRTNGYDRFIRRLWVLLRNLLFPAVVIEHCGFLLAPQLRQLYS